MSATETTKSRKHSRQAFFQMNFDEDVEVLVEPELALTNLPDGSVHERRTITCGDGRPHYKGLTFRDCQPNNQEATRQLRGLQVRPLRISPFSTDRMQFSDCTFNLCHFAFMTVDGCSFLDCSFMDVSASAEHVKWSRTQISATSFLDAITTNVSHLRLGKAPANNEQYQRYRIVGTKAKLARAIYVATAEVADIDTYLEANKELVLRTLEWRARIHDMHIPNRESREPKRRNRLAYLRLSTVYQSETVDTDVWGIGRRLATRLVAGRRSVVCHLTAG